MLAPGESQEYVPSGSIPQPSVTYRPYGRRRFQDRVWKHVVLLLLTVVTTTWAGTLYYVSFAGGFGRRPVVLDWSVAWHGLWYSIPVLLILGAHEMGHYLFCRRYNVDATLPFFIPPPMVAAGTFGAVIRIKSPMTTRNIIFDIGVAGPIAGFVVLVPVLFWGMALSELLPTPRSISGIAFGEPLLFKAVAYLMFGHVQDGLSLNAHPMVFAAWFGMFATALNLLPFGQLDGGHITYATLRSYSTRISIITVLAAIGMTFVSSGWVAMTIIMLLMLLTFGPRHPQVLDEEEPLGPGRRAVAIFALVMLVLCFTPIPIEPLEVLGRR